MKFLFIDFFSLFNKKNSLKGILKKRSWKIKMKKVFKGYLIYIINNESNFLYTIIKTLEIE